MAGAAFSIKLRCASWQQLATIYRRDLSRGAMFLKASTQPPLGTIVRIDLELPSATVIELQGTITEHVVDPQRGTGVNLKLDALPTKSVWMIESALAAENKVRAQSQSEATAPAAPAPAPRAVTLSDGEDVAAAEVELIKALEAEAESLRKLNPFLVLGVGYETTDGDVRAAFGELTKRYHPDRFVRYQSAKLRQIAAEIFILIRDAYRRLADDKGRQQVLATLGPKIPTRAQTQPRGSAVVSPAVRPATPPVAIPSRVAVPPTKASVPDIPPVPAKPILPDMPPRPPAAATHDVPTLANPHDAPTNQSAKSAQLAHTELAKSDALAIPVERPIDRPIERPVDRSNDRGDASRAPTVSMSSRSPTPATGVATDKLPPRKTSSPIGEPADTSALEALIDEDKLDEALAGFRAMSKKYPQDRGVRAGVELCEGLKALAMRDRLEAAQRFEAALELDPSNERAARELAEMRRHATNERKGLLSRLMGKKEPP